jgi:tRNA (guanosine-2'-O-)-methyltransferase
MAAERIQKIKKVLNRRQTDLTVVMDNVHKPQNMAAIARTCDAVGIPEIHVINNNRRHSFLNAKSAGGCKKWINTVSYKNIGDAYKKLNDQGFQILAAHFSDTALPFRSFDYTVPTAIVVGAELDGMSDEAANLADQHIIIPMMGMSQSLNVSVAAALILFEAQRQREDKGMYDNATSGTQTFPLEWAYPSVAKKYRIRNLKLPRIDEKGNIL